MSVETKLNMYFTTTILSILFAVIGFSYNAWRLEATEDNNNIRTAAFEVLINLAELEQIIYAAHYDKDKVEGNPRKGWVKIGLIVDLSTMVGDTAEAQATKLLDNWSQHWEDIPSSQRVTDEMIKDLDICRHAVKITLDQLK